MLDFTRALYLGMHHSSRTLRPWDQLTNGLPAVVESPVEHVRVARRVARLMGMESATVARSTLHLIFDIFSSLSNERVTLYVDSGVYPIVRWGVAWAVALGVQVNMFRHHDVEALAQQIRRNTLGMSQPIVITDGWCPRCGQAAPIDQYLEQVRRFGGMLIMDDTQALGIFGYCDNSRPTQYGQGGGGLLRWFGLTGLDIVVVSSLAKAFGAPLAVLTSSTKIISRFKTNSKTRMHSSQPSAADVLAAEHALDLNVSYGDTLRQRLSQLIRQFRHGLTEMGLVPKGALFPVQILTADCGIDPPLLYRQLYRIGVRTILLGADPPHQMELAFVINARQSPNDIRQAVDSIAKCVRQHNTKNIKELNYGSSILSTKR